MRCVWYYCHRCYAWILVQRPMPTRLCPPLFLVDPWHSDIGTIWWSTMHRTNRSSTQYLVTLLTVPPSSNSTRVIQFNPLISTISKSYSTRIGPVSSSIITFSSLIRAYQELLVCKVCRFHSDSLWYRYTFDCSTVILASSVGPAMNYSVDQANSVSNNLILTFDTNTGTFVG